MAQVVVGNLDESVKARLKRRAVLNGPSMGEEVRQILVNAAKAPSPAAVTLGSRIADLLAGIGLEEGIPKLSGGRPPLATFGTSVD